MCIDRLGVHTFDNSSHFFMVSVEESCPDLGPFRYTTRHAIFIILKKDGSWKTSNCKKRDCCSKIVIRPIVSGGSCYMDGESQMVRLRKTIHRASTYLHTEVSRYRQMSDPTLLQSFEGNLLAIACFSVFAGASWVCRKKCRHQTWAVHSSCFECRGDDIVTEHERPEGLSEV